MRKENKFLISLWAVLCTAFLFLGFADAKINPRLQQKLHSAVQNTFELEEFELVHLPIDAQTNENTLVELGGENLFEIHSMEQLKGYVYLGQAPSMKQVFDYVVLFNTDLSIKKAKVLIYREDYGRQIGSQRWLKQFIGKTPEDVLDYGTDIDAIAGATISAKSMNKAVNEVLSSMRLLQTKNLLQ